MVGLLPLETMGIIGCPKTAHPIIRQAKTNTFILINALIGE
jgi:hypothetical protein